MNNIEALIESFEKKGIHLFMDGEKLRYKASKELMTAEVLSQLKAHKAEIIEQLNKSANENTFVIDRTHRYEPFPLTDVQSAYMLGRSKTFEYGGVACHVYLEIKYQELDTQKVRDIWNALVAKYDMLHAVINEGGFQQVLKEIPTLEIPEWDLVKHPESATAFENFRKEMGCRAYTIGKWPMFGLAVSRSAEGAILHFSIEFLLADWTSIWKLVAEFEAAYFDGIAVSGEEEVSFRDYLIAEKKIKSSARYEKEKSYWMNRIAELPEAPELPKLPANESKDSFGRKFLRIPADAWNRMKARAKQYGLTPTVPILSCYADVLAKWSQSKRFCINMTVLNRLPLHEKVMDIVGDFTSLSLLEVDLSKRENFLVRTRRLNARLFEDLDNRLFSGVEVMREISRQSKKSSLSMPIVYTSAIGLADSGTPLRGEFSGGISQTPQTFIDCQVMDGTFGLQVNWDYREGVFPAGVLEAMFDAFEKRLLALANENADWENIAEIALPTRDAAERFEANDTKKKWNVRLLQNDFIESVKRTPQKIAIDDGHVKFTFEELDARAKVLASKLIKLGVKPQDCVPVLMEKSSWQIVSVFGILYAGAIYVPIAAAKAKGRAEKIVKKTGAKVAIGISTDEALLENKLTTINVDTLSNDATAIDTTTFPKRIPEDIAYIIYTSGSTGEPKGVVITHKGAMNTIDDMNDRFNVTADDAVLGLSQLNFDLSVYDIFGVLAHGGTVIFPTAEDYMNPEAWEALIHKHNITVWNTVPALMKMLLNFVESKSSAEPLPLKEVFLSGDWIPVDMPEKIRKFAPNVDVICLGGATEASIWSNYHRYHPDDGLKILPYGRPLANQTMHILDENLEPCPTMVTGQIALGGDGVALGYYLDEERPTAQFVDLPSTGEHVYLTGDMGRYLPGGEIEFQGRKDNQVKIRGHRIELGEIENVLRDYEFINNAAVVVAPDHKEIYAMIETLAGYSDESLKSYLDKFLLHYMIPSIISPVEHLPLSANGKIDRKKIVEFFVANKESAAKNSTTDSSVPTTPLEKEILEIWSKALKSDNLGLDSNFYDFGADSLTMAQVATTLRNGIASKVPFDALLKQMLDEPTVKDTVKFLTEMPKDVNSQKSEMLKVIRYGKANNDCLRVLLPAIFWNADKFNILVEQLIQQDLGEIIFFGLNDLEEFCKLKPKEVGPTLAKKFAEAVLATNYKKVQIITYCYISPVGIEMAERLIDKGIEIVDFGIIDGSRLGFQCRTNAVRDIFFAEMIGVDFNKWGLDIEDFVVKFNKMMDSTNKKIITDKDVELLSKELTSGDKLVDFMHMSDDEKLDLCIKYTNAFGENAERSTFERLVRMFNQGFNVMTDFTPAPLFGNLRYFKAHNDDGIYRYFDILYHDWDELCLGELEVSPIPGNHLTCLSNPEYVKVVADKLNYKNLAR